MRHGSSRRVHARATLKKKIKKEEKRHRKLFLREKKKIYIIRIKEARIVDEAISIVRGRSQYMYMLLKDYFRISGL